MKNDVNGYTILLPIPNVEIFSQIWKFQNKNKTYEFSYDNLIRNQPYKREKTLRIWKLNLQVP